jgi:hypothetical protein
MSLEKPTSNMFESLYEKFGSNFFLACFVASLTALTYLYFDGKKCEDNTLILEQKHSQERAKDKDDMINYFIQKETQFKTVERETEAIERETQKTEKQLSKLKKDLK